MNMFKNETDFKKYISDEYINEFFSRKEESDEESEYDEDEYDDEKEALRKKAKKDSKNLQIQFEKNPENYDWSDESYFNYRTQKAIPPPKSRPLDTDPLLYWVYWIWRHGNYELMSQAGWGVKQIIVEKNGVVKKYQ